MLRAHALDLLTNASLEEKLQALASTATHAVDTAQSFPEPPAPFPKRAARPQLVPPTKVPKRGLKTRTGRLMLLHALAHIECNAIDLALDIIWRFAKLPEAFYRDWWRVAKEEALHFSLVRDYLRDLGADYGDFAAHNGLWALAERTQDDVLARLALVPRIVEAHGLDVAPEMRDKFLQVGDTRAAEILQRILTDEIGHVSLGNHWFYMICAQRQLDPIEHAQRLSERYHAPKFSKYFNLEARTLAGFLPQELAQFEHFNQYHADKNIE